MSEDPLALGRRVALGDHHRRIVMAVVPAPLSPAKKARTGGLHDSGWDGSGVYRAVYGAYFFAGRVRRFSGWAGQGSDRHKIARSACMAG